MTGHGWVWPIDENGDPIGAPVEMHNVSLKGANRGSGYPLRAPLELTGHDGPIPEHLRELFASNDVQVAENASFDIFADMPGYLAILRRASGELYVECVTCGRIITQVQRGWEREALNRAEDLHPRCDRSL